jgi:hypothetical protein
MEASQAHLNDTPLNTLSETSKITNKLNTLGQTADSSYNQPPMHDVLHKLDEFLNAARR